MATFIPYTTYVPTPPRQRVSYPSKPAWKQSSNKDQSQRSKLGVTTLSTSQTVADVVVCSKIVFRDQSKAIDGDDEYNEFPSIENLLRATLPKESSTLRDQRLKNTACGEGNTAAEGRGGSFDDYRSAPSDNPSTGLDLIVLAGDDNSSVSDAEAERGLGPEITAENGGLLPEIDIEPAIPSLSQTDVWPNNDFLEAQRCEQNPLDPDLLWPYSASPPRASTELLSDDTVSSLAHSSNQLPDYPPADTSIHDNFKMARPGLSVVILDKGGRQEQAQEAEDVDSDNDDEGSRQPQRDMGEDVTAPLMSTMVDNTSLSSEIDERQASEDDSGSHDDSYSDNELNDAESNDEDRIPRSVQRKRKRHYSSYHGLTQTKQKHTCHLQQNSSRNNSASIKRHHHSQQTRRHKYRGDSSSNRHFPNSQPRFDQRSRFPAASRAITKLPSLSPSTPRNIISELTNDGFSEDVQPTLIEITFRPHSPHCCSFSAVIQEGCEGQGVSFSQLTHFFKSIGHFGQIVDFTFKSSHSRSFLITGFTQHPTSQPASSGVTVSTAEAGRIYRNTKRTRSQDGRAVDAGSLALQSEPASGNGDSGLSDSDPESNSDSGGSSSGDELGCSNTSKNAQWEDVDELRLLAYKKEDKSWDWIFKKFPARTQNAVRSRWTIAKRKYR